MSNRVSVVFSNVHMAMSHEGLTKLARKFKRKVEDLEDGEIMLFINTNRTKAKVLARHGVIAYLSLPQGRRLDLAALQYIPRTFNEDGSFDYDKALKERVVKSLEKRGKLSDLQVYS